MSYRPVEPFNAADLEGVALESLIQKRRHADGVVLRPGQRAELVAVAVVFAAERAFGRIPVDRSEQRGIGYDIESAGPDGELVFIEVKGRVEGADAVTVTTNELKCGNNKPDSFRLAISTISGDQASPPRYVSGIDWGRPGFGSTGQNFSLAQLLFVAEGPH